MSLVCHTIVSRYTPQQRDPIPQTDVADDVDPWQTESSFGPARRLHARPAPSFVRASLVYDEYGIPKADTGTLPYESKTDDALQDVSTWYRSLTARGKSRAEEQVTTLLSSMPDTSNTSMPPPHHQFPFDLQLSSCRSSLPSPRPNWFMSRPPGSASTHDSKPSTLADLLSRHPPPLSSEPSFSPPVFLSIGPSNKGFTMLERKGWREGEGLGSARVERRPREGLGVKRALEAAFQECNHRKRDLAVGQSDLAETALIEDASQEVIDLTGSDTETYSTREIVDLTLTDSEPDDDDTVELPLETSPSDSAPHGTTLLTPITTTLKADRLGIGLKPARRPSSVKAKAITHTSAALAAHIRIGNQARKNRVQRGHGSRGFARDRRKEEKQRVEMLAYMNS